MAKKVKANVKLQIAAGKATPAPPVGTALGPHGINIMAFVKEYNERTSSQVGQIVPAEITIFEDRSFTFVTKTPPATDLIKRAINVDKGSTDPGRKKAGEISRAKIHDIAQLKLKDLNALDIAAAERMIEGTARSMGIEVVD